ncbi:MAG TPA: hypothetical protein DEQ43_03525 [Nocardioides bacterium]|nr:hypothetical protein [Nocardioides sp.]
MAHGLGGTKDSGLEPFASALAEAGLDVLAFDDRGFGASGGTPRQRVDLAGQVDAYRAAMTAAARLPGVDPERLVLWGASLARAAEAGRAEVRHYPCDHFDVWPGNDWFAPVVDHQLYFLRRHLWAARPRVGATDVQ